MTRKKMTSSEPSRHHVIDIHSPRRISVEEEKPVEKKIETVQPQTKILAPQRLETYTIEQVAKHDTEDSCWVIINGRVFDVTTFLYDHPGGIDMLLDHAGDVDASQEFARVNHSTKARYMMDNYCIGLLEENDEEYYYSEDSSE